MGLESVSAFEDVIGTHCTTKVLRLGSWVAQGKTKTIKQLVVAIFVPFIRKQSLNIDTILERSIQSWEKNERFAKLFS